MAATRFCCRRGSPRYFVAGVATRPAALTPLIPPPSRHVPSRNAMRSWPTSSRATGSVNRPGVAPRLRLGDEYFRLGHPMHVQKRADLAPMRLCAGRAEQAGGGTLDRRRLAGEELAVRTRSPADRVLGHPEDRAIELGRHEQRRVDGRGGSRKRCTGAGFPTALTSSLSNGNSPISAASRITPSGARSRAARSVAVLYDPCAGCRRCQGL